MTTVNDSMQNGNILMIYTICKNPSDFPDKFTIRRHLILPKGIIRIDITYLVVRDSLEECRTEIPAGLVICPRDINDDPVIIESYL